MRPVVLRALSFSAALVLVSPVLAQAPGGGGGGRGGFGFGMGQMSEASALLLNPSVQEELKLTDEQKADLHKVREKQQAAFQKARESGDREKGRALMQAAGEEIKKEVDKWKETALKPDQNKRLRQIQLQVMGVRAFADADVQKDLKLTDKQQAEAKEIVDATDKDAREILQGMRDARGNPDKAQEIRKKAEAVRKEGMDKMASLLNDDQKKAWKELTGEKFEIKFEPPQGGGGRRRQGGQAGGGGKAD
jgi:hypothetical protein